MLIFASYYYIARVYLASARELKRSESVSKSPILILFSEMLGEGTSSVRAFGDGGRFTRKLLGFINTNSRPFFTLWQGNRWLSVFIELVGSVSSALCALFVVFASHMDPAKAGFILSFALALNERLLWICRLWAINEISFNSVERITSCTYAFIPSLAGLD